MNEKTNNPFRLEIENLLEPEIYRDYGKTAVTLIRRRDGKAIRLVLAPEFEEVSVEIPSFAPIFESAKCVKCGENVMKTRIVEIDRQPYCIPSANESFFELNGSGISYRK